MEQYGMTRRQLFTAMLAGTLPLGAQMASRGVKAMPRGKPTGLPFRASLTDVAAQAGLRQPIVYGGVARWDPLESTCRHASLSIL